MAGPSNKSKEQTITLLHIASYSKVTKVNSWSLIGFVQLLNKSNHDSWPVDMVFIIHKELRKIEDPKGESRPRQQAWSWSNRKNLSRCETHME